MLLGALALTLIAGSASAVDLSSTLSYQDSGTTVATATVAGPVVGPFVADLTGAVEVNNDVWTQRVEIGGSLFNDRFAVRAALGEKFGTSDFMYYSFTPSVQLDVPYTDKFVVSARYRNSFEDNNYETYGAGVRAGWNVGPVVLSAGVAAYTGDTEYTEYTVGVSRKF